MADANRNEISIDGVRYVSASQAAAEFGFVGDYVARLARTGKIRGRQLGRNWYVDRDALERFSARQEHLREVRRHELVRERIAEYRAASDVSRIAIPQPKSPPRAPRNTRPGLSNPPPPRCPRAQMDSMDCLQAAQSRRLPMPPKQIMFAGIAYVPSRDAARLVGLTADYISRLARVGLIAGLLDDGVWFVSLDSLRAFMAEQDRQKELRRAQLAAQRREEQRLAGHPSALLA